MPSSGDLFDYLRNESHRPRAHYTRAHSISIRRVDEPKRETIRYLFDNRDNGFNRFIEAIAAGELDPVSLGNLATRINDAVLVDVLACEHTEIREEIGKQFFDQAEKWDINPLCTHRHPHAPIPWTRHQWPHIKLPADSTSYDWFTPRKNGARDYIEATLKLINCLTEFKFGECLLPNIKPTQPYEPVCLQDIYEAWKIAPSKSDQNPEFSFDHENPPWMEDPCSDNSR